MRFCKDCIYLRAYVSPQCGHPDAMGRSVDLVTGEVTGPTARDERHTHYGNCGPEGKHFVANPQAGYRRFKWWWK